MAELDTNDRNRLRDSSFAWIDKQGERHLPINDESHIRSAIARFNQTDFDETAAKSAAARKIPSAARKHGIEVDDDAVAKAAKR
jgi:adenosine deaminase